MFDIALIQLYDNQFNNKDMDVPCGLDCSAVYAVLQVSKQRSKFTSCFKSYAGWKLRYSYSTKVIFSEMPYTIPTKMFTVDILSYHMKTFMQRYFGLFTQTYNCSFTVFVGSTVFCPE